MSTYLCYDLRAIQSFIFRIPKLKYIIGGSALIDRFDREVAPSLCKLPVSVVSCGGGKGAFFCPTEAAAADLEAQLVAKAHDFGIDIRIGTHPVYSEAVHCASRLYPFVPAPGDGHPCQISGLYPVDPETAGKDKVHPIVKRRVMLSRDKNYRYFESRLLAQNLDLGPGAIGHEPVFLRAVDEGERDPAARAGLASLGGRFRWAVICMDGNDMGRQFGARMSQAADGAEQVRSWVQSMSRALDRCAVEAAKAGIEAVVRAWAGSDSTGELLRNSAFDDDGSRQLVLPIRPLVVGGDDIAVLCHPRFAFTFVKKAAAAWENESKRAAAEYRAGAKDHSLWPATGNQLSISAGVFFCPSSLPLHTAIPYAESLLASAKSRGREVQKRRGATQQPTPASIDWEFATESILDTPSERRKRELSFHDQDIAEDVQLTQRPYTLAELEVLEERADGLAKVPRSIRNQVLEGLRAGAHDRELFRLRISKRHPDLAKAIDESTKESWWQHIAEGAKKRRTTPVVDAVMLLEESARQEERSR